MKISELTNLAIVLVGLAMITVGFSNAPPTGWGLLAYFGIFLFTHAMTLNMPLWTKKP